MNTATQNSLNFLRKINALKVGSMPLYDFFTYRDYSVWSFLQSSIFTDIRMWQEGPPAIAKGPIPKRSFRVFLFRCFFFFLAVIAILRAAVGERRVLLFAIDNAMGPHYSDFRMGELYKYLVGRGIPFLEILHGIPGKKLLKNFRARGRLVIYLEVAVGVYWALKRLGRRRKFPRLDYGRIAWDGFTSAEKEFTESILPKYIEHAELTAFKMDFFTRLFRMLKPKMFLTIDDTRYYHELLFAARQNGIQSHAFQHGRFDRYITPLMFYGLPAQKCILPDFFWTWNTYHQQKLIRLSDVFRMFPDRVRVGGKPFDKHIPQFGIHHSIKNRITVLMLAERYAPPREIEAFIEKILERGMNIIFSLRTDISLDDQRRLFNLERYDGNKNFRVVAGFTQQDWDSVDVVAGTSSTFLDELIEAGKPVAVLDTTTTTIEDLVEDGLAEMLDVNAVDHLERIARTDPLILKQRQDILRTTMDIKKTLDGIFRTFSGHL